jgi:hypothetical protein
MKKLTSIVLLLLFSFVLINVASAESQKCQKEKIAASYTGDMSHISQSCRNQDEFGEIFGLIFKVIGFGTLGLFGIIVLFAMFSKDKDSVAKNKEFDDTPKGKINTVKGGSFIDERKTKRPEKWGPVPAHPIDDEQFIGKEYANSIFFSRSDLKFRKQEMIALANYYSAKYDETDTIKVIQEKLYDALERELSSGRFQNSYRLHVVLSFRDLGWHFDDLIKYGETGKTVDERDSIFFDLIKSYEEIAQSSKYKNLR